MRTLLLCVLLLICVPYAYADSSIDNSENLPVVVPKGVEAQSTWTQVTAPGQVSAGAPVKIKFVVRNTSHSPINYAFGSSQQFDILVSDATGKQIWNWSKARVFSQLVTHQVIKVGQDANYYAVWNQRDDSDHPVPPGMYTIQATLLPLSKTEVSGTIISNRENDPMNMGFPTHDSIGSGAVEQHETTPQVAAKTTITITQP